MNHIHEIHNSDKLNQFVRIHQNMVTSYPTNDLGFFIQAGKEKLARMVAKLIVEKDKFVKFTADDFTLKQRIDVIVLTEEELAQLMTEQFKAGIAHANHFKP